MGPTIPYFWKTIWFSVMWGTKNVNEQILILMKVPKFFLKTVTLHYILALSAPLATRRPGRFAPPALPPYASDDIL